MSLFDMLSNYNPSLKATLKQAITFQDGDEEITFEAGTKSSILIDNKDGTYHFEAGNHAVSVTEEELNFN